MNRDELIGLLYEAPLKNGYVEENSFGIEWIAGSECRLSVEHLADWIKDYRAAGILAALERVNKAGESGTTGDDQSLYMGDMIDEIRREIKNGADAS